MAAPRNSDPLAPFHPAVREWFTAAFEAPTRPQTLGWPAIARGDSTLILAPTGSGKTLAAFLWCLDRLMFAEPPPRARAVPRALRLAAQGAGGRRRAQPARAAGRHRAGRRGARRSRSSRRRLPSAPAIRRAAERARFQREPADILITTPESLYLLLTSNAREALRSIDTVIIDEIHALVPTKRGAHLALSIERLAALLRSPAAADRPVGDAAAARRGRAVSRRRRDARPRHGLRAAHPPADRRRAGKTRAHRAGEAPTRIAETEIADEFAAARRHGPLPAGDHRRRRREEGAEADASRCRSRTWRG